MADIVAAGILFLTKDNQALFLKRAGDDCAGFWGLPGGKVEDGETLEQAARREANEEIGAHPEGELLLLTRRVAEVAVPTAISVSGGVESPLVPSDTPPLALPIVDFTTFVQRVDAPFEPTLNEEHTGYAWAPISSPPEPLHPGCRVSCARPNMNELDVARAMVAGELEGSQHFINMTMFAMRITGTGLAYRIGLDEHVWRRPEIYLNPEFLARCNGLPVVVQHPETRTLNSKEFADRIIGTIFLPYIKGEEVWGIAKVWDDTAVEMLENNQLSTSPGVQFRNPKMDNIKLAGTDGSVLLIEGNPVLIDHLAVCQKGVWDKGGEPRGIQFDETREDSVMTDEERKALAARAAAGDIQAKNELARADAAEGDDKEKAKADDDDVKGLLSKVLDSIGNLGKRMDSFEEAEKARKDSEEQAKKDAENEAKAKADAEAEEKRAKGDEEQAKKDAEAKEKADAEEKAKADAARADADAATRARIEELASKLPVQMTDADHNALIDAQAKADAVMSLEGKSAPRPLQGETPVGYRRRMATALKVHSKHWKDVDLGAIADDAAFGNIENAIYADAAEALRNPVDLPEGQLREIVRQDVTGRRISSFNGQPSAWMNQFSSNRRRLTSVRNAS